MARKLILEQFGGLPLAEITQTAEGKLSIQTLATGLEAEIQALVQRVSAQPLRLMGGKTEEKNGNITHITTVSTVTGADHAYLYALADALSKPDCKVQGKRVLAYVEEEK